MNEKPVYVHRIYDLFLKVFRKSGKGRSLWMGLGGRPLCFKLYARKGLIGGKTL